MAKTIIAGKGDGIVTSENKGVLYYVQLLYKNNVRTSYSAETVRDEAYGQELEFIPIPGSPELGFRQVKREDAYYVVYRAKGVHITGYKNETVPSIELLLQIPAESSLESIVVLKDKWVGQLKPAVSAEFGFTAKSPKKDQVSDFIGEFSLVAEQCSGLLKGTMSDIVDVGSWLFTYQSKILVSGPVSDVLHIYSFLPNALQRMNKLEYADLVMSFN